MNLMALLLVTFTMGRKELILFGILDCSIIPSNDFYVIFNENIKCHLISQLKRFRFEVLRFLLSNLRWYQDEYKFDGFRYDLVIK